MAVELGELLADYRGFFFKLASASLIHCLGEKETSQICGRIDQVGVCRVALIEKAGQIVKIEIEPSLLLDAFVLVRRSPVRCIAN